MAFFTNFVRGLGNQTAPFGFDAMTGTQKLGHDPAYKAGMQFIGNVGLGMLAQSNKNPLEAFGRSYLNAQDQAQEQNKNQYLAAQMLQEADYKKQERARAEQDRQAREKFLSTLTPEQQMKARSIPGYLEDLVQATDPSLQQPQEPKLYSVGGALVDSSGRVVYQGQDAGGKPPLGYRFTADGNLEAIKGGPADPHVKASAGAGGVTTKMRNDAVSAQQAYNNLSAALDDYKTLVQKTGVSVLPGQENDQIAQARTNLQLQLKELYNLGVLNGPDLSLMENMIFDPQVSWNPMNTAGKLYSAAGGWGSTSIEDRATASIDNLKKTLKTIVDNKTKGILDAPAAPDVTADANVPDGLTPEEWNAMTPEERALWQ